MPALAPDKVMVSPPVRALTVNAVVVRVADVLPLYTLAGVPMTAAVSVAGLTVSVLSA